MDGNYTVYLHLFPNGKRYVGITCQKVERRWRNGKAYTWNRHMMNAISKYGWGNIEHIILAEGLTQEAAGAMEIKLIADLRLTDPKFGYNYATGGTHPRHTEQTKRKIGERSLGRRHTQEFKEWISAHNSGKNNYMYGKHHSTETKKKISEAKKGTPSPNKGKFGASNPHAKRVFAKKGNQTVVYNSIVEAAKETGACKSCIQAALHGRGHTAGGYVWGYADG